MGLSDGFLDTIRCLFCRKGLLYRIQFKGEGASALEYFPGDRLTPELLAAVSRGEEDRSLYAVNLTRHGDTIGTFRIDGTAYLIGEGCVCGEQKFIECSAVVENGVYRGFADVKNSVGLRQVIEAATESPTEDGILSLVDLFFDRHEMPQAFQMAGREIPTGEFLFYSLLTVHPYYWEDEFFGRLSELEAGALFSRGLLFMLGLLPQLNSKRAVGLLTMWRAACARALRNLYLTKPPEEVTPEERTLSVFFGGPRYELEETLAEIDKALDQSSRESAGPNFARGSFLARFLDGIRRRTGADTGRVWTAPCPYCGEGLPTALAKQCPHCFTDWHDPYDVKRLK